MKKVLFFNFLFFLSVKVFSQQFSQYNTGTLYDSFENPSQRSFIPDSSRQYASNFFLPNFNANFRFTGDAQTAFKTRIFADAYDASAIPVGTGRYNYLQANASAYLFMFKMFTNLEGSREVGFFIKTSAESRGIISNESLAIFNGFDKFTNDTYNDIFNNRFSYQTYHQIGMSFREQVTPKLAIGVKMGLLSGIDYQKFSFYQSQIDFNRTNNQALLTLSGVHYSASWAGRSTIIENMGFDFRNPGVAISIGAAYKTDDAYKFQFNIKDLGVIHWSNSRSKVSYFESDKAPITITSNSAAEKSVSDAVGYIVNYSATQTTRGFYYPINGIIEASVNKDYWLNYNQTLKFSPTVILAKEIFYPGFTGALVAPVQYDKYVVTLTPSYNDLRLLSVGGQFMIKTPDTDFYIGSDALYQTISFTKEAIQSGNYTPGKTGRFTGANFFIGLTFKFGNVIEHPMNASYIPMGEKGFFGRLYERIFKKDKNY
ncbi:hypothetical protein GCM10027049_12250 [Mucilaginibacter puniceus]